MPKFLKNATIMLLDGGIESYLLGLYGMAMPSLRIRYKQEAKFAPIMGLYGAAAELLVKACLVQGKGISAMYKDGNCSLGVYCYGSDVIDDLRRSLSNEDRQMAFIWSEQDGHQEQKEKLLHYLGKFKLLQQLRANGLHAGLGCSRDIAISAATDIYGFVQLLSQSKKLKPYLKNIPAPEATIRDREAIIEDLTRRLHLVKSDSSKTALLRNMYLVLPYIPEIKPDWIDVFDRIAVAPPTESDLTYLAKTLSDAHSIYLLKNRGGKEGIPVRIDPANPDALPIAIQNIKRTLTTIPDKFHNDVMTANTRLDEHRLDLPIEEFLVDLYALGLNETHICEAGKQLTAQQVWPFVAAAYSSSGTPRPCWFLIRACDEINQLLAYMRRAGECGNGYLKRRMPEVIAALLAIQNNTTVNFENAKDTIFKGIVLHREKISKYTTEQKEPFTPFFLKKYPINDDIRAIIHEFVTKSMNAGDTLAKILEKNELDENGKKAALMLLPLCFNGENKNGLISVLRTEHLKGYTSEARKMMFFADFMENGPQLG